ncbi:hypothetical protein [Yoonia sediminilitoris]|uniref:Uncharacterized protein n=1 Tax=Yoonia sediminilitoris TaxID=1286148 RepID=A0A2T6KK79_9RHOB|nr:hypothetical protein [Yoonia sediminilitoris]PUB16345.1 hypothetical protein C8N45_103200 [Yoonia sediminilitoris]RCW96694.1 hypothetical protein DFP92_103200 [Yoonia sediminilitoris]
MQISTKTAFISCSIIAATACGGGGEEETFGDIEYRYLPVMERLHNSPELPSSEIPTTGKANYAGVA